MKQKDDLPRPIPGTFWTRNSDGTVAKAAECPPGSPYVVMQPVMGSGYGKDIVVPIGAWRGLWTQAEAPRAIVVKQVWRRKTDGVDARVMKVSPNLVQMALPLGGGRFWQFNIKPNTLRADWEPRGFKAIILPQPEAMPDLIEEAASSGSTATRCLPPEIAHAFERDVPPAPTPARKHGHYFRGVAHLQEIDVYRVLELFNVTDQALGHAIKKLVVPGMRGGGKPAIKDIQEAVDTLQRWLQMRGEDAAAELAKVAPGAIKPWYPDDGAWVEVPDTCRVCPLPSHMVVQILQRGERKNQNLDSDVRPLPARDWCWDALPDIYGRIVAYKVVS